MRDAVQHERPWLLLPRPMCGFCGIRSAQVGDLCCFCDEDADSKAEYLARMARVES